MGKKTHKGIQKCILSILSELNLSLLDVRISDAVENFILLLSLAGMVPRKLSWGGQI